MLLYLFSAVAARTVLLRANSETDLAKFRETNIIDNELIEVAYDKDIAKNEFVVETQKVSVPAKDTEELGEVLRITETFSTLPSEIPDIFEALAAPKSTSLVEDLKTGAFSFAIFFTNDSANVLSLKGIEASSGFKYFFSSDEELAKKLGATEFPCVVAYNAVDKNTVRIPFYDNFASTYSAFAISAFSKVTSDNFKHLQSLQQNIFYIIDKSENYPKIKKSFENQMKGFSSAAKFVFFTPEEIPALISLVNTNDSQYPLLINLNKEIKSIVRGVTVDNFAQSVEDLVNNKAELLRFAAKIPEDNETRAVKVINTDTIATVKKNDTVDRLIAFTSPKCGFCQQLKPVLEKLGKALLEKGVDIYVGNYNVVENESVTDIPITGVPTIFYIKKGTDTMIKLPNELRSLGGLLEFISKEGVSAKVVMKDFAEITAEEVNHLLHPEDDKDEEDEDDDEDAVADEEIARTLENNAEAENKQQPLEATGHREKAVL